MRDRNKSPVTIRPGEDNALTVVWTNRVQICWEFCIRYLAGDGMEETSEGAADIFAHVFHGKCRFTRTNRKGQEPKTVLRPVIHALHFSLTAHRSRFMTDVEVHWKELYQLLDKHPDWDRYLDDKGAGSPPQSFNIAIEKAQKSTHQYYLYFLSFEFFSCSELRDR